MIKLRFSINIKIFLGILSILIAVMFIGYNVFNITNQKDTIYNDSLSVYEFTCKIKEIKATSSKIPILMHEYKLHELEDDGRQYSRVLEDMNATLNYLSSFSNDADKLIVITNLKKIMREFPEKLVLAVPIVEDLENLDKSEELIKLEKEAAEEAANEILIIEDNILNQVDLIDKFLSKVEADNKQELADMHDLANKKSSELLWWIIFGTVLCSSLALLTALIMMFLVTRPLKKVIHVIDDISKGDLSTTISEKTLKTNDEIGDLARSFERTMVSLKLAMKQNKTKE